MPTFRSSLLLAITVVLSRFSASLPAAETPTPQQLAFFRDRVQPVFEKHCDSCHSAKAKQVKGSFRLDSKAAWQKGGDSGEPAIKPGKPDESLLIKAVRHAEPGLAMPPDQPRLPDAVIADLVEWVRQGAPDPRDEPSGPQRADQTWWSVQPVRSVQPPSPKNLPEAWLRNPIDRFVAAKLAEKQLAPNPRADRRTLIRRLTVDLHGLLPSAERVDQFVADNEAQATDKLIDELLASPRYGERWARHWLDIAHYADTHGFERDMRRSNAWPYRDWVIDALNRDLPYDEFLRRQIAGDVLKPTDREGVIATGFLTAGPWDFVGNVETRSDVLKRAARAGDLDDIVTQVMTAACAMTVNCARCHDHKLDPIPQRDYYKLAAVFSGVSRGERNFDDAETQKHAQTLALLRQQMSQTEAAINRLNGAPLDLADIVGGGNGLGSGTVGKGIDVRTGKPQDNRIGFLANFKPNTFARGPAPFVDGVVVPQSGEPVPITSTGIKVDDVPKNSGQGWDAVRFGPVNAQDSTTLDGTDFAKSPHSLLGLHANAAITFDLAAIRDFSGAKELRFTSLVGHGGKNADSAADFQVYVDGALAARQLKLKFGERGVPVDIALPQSARFLTLMATDSNNGIGHDQIFFANPRLNRPSRTELVAAEAAELAQLNQKKSELEQQLRNLPAPGKVFSIASSQPAAMHLLRRGDAEQPREAVLPGALSWIATLPPDFGADTLSDGERRRALAQWITDPQHPLTRRVIVNRLWHHHFGQGLVTTPSDFGSGGDLPSHPDLLDWLATELLAQKWSLKALHRVICRSETYQQASTSQPTAQKLDAGNRWLWRQNARRLDAESLRDSVLQVSGKLNLVMGGPGFEDFRYTEAYAPIYDYVTADSPPLWRRSIYRFVVRTTPQQFLTTLDCPNPANLTPARLVTTTALQALALSNNEFMLKQAGYLAERITSAAGSDEQAQVTLAFRYVLQRVPSETELKGALQLIRARGLLALCRALLNANEFVYLD